MQSILMKDHVKKTLILTFLLPLFKQQNVKHRSVKTEDLIHLQKTSRNISVHCREPPSGVTAQVYTSSTMVTLQSRLIIITCFPYVSPQARINFQSSEVKGIQFTKVVKQRRFQVGGRQEMSPSKSVCLSRQTINSIHALPCRRNSIFWGKSM